MYGVEKRFKMSFLLGLKGVPLYREIPATKYHLMNKCKKPQIWHLFNGKVEKGKIMTIEWINVRCSLRGHWTGYRSSFSGILKRAVFIG